jgi:hypothetical protein
MRRLVGNQKTIIVEGREILTLRDILPATPGLRVLFVAKTPAPVSVEVGHYFQGKQGTMFWKRLKDYGLLKPTTKFEDDSLVGHRYGLTDIVKVPRAYGNEPSEQEYMDGTLRILDAIRIHRPRVVVFVYKKVLDSILRLHFAIKEKSSYGFNQPLETYFGARVSRFHSPELGAARPPSPRLRCKSSVITCKRRICGCQRFRPQPSDQNQTLESGPPPRFSEFRRAGGIEASDSIH